MTFSFTQISQYVACPRRYRYRYLDGWKEKDDRNANRAFGRTFELALAAYFRRQDCVQIWFEEWQRWQDADLEYRRNDSWDRMLQQGIQLLERFCQDNRITVHQPEINLLRKFVLPLSASNDFVAYVDAIAQIDGRTSIVDWKATSRRFGDEDHELLSLDPQLTCYSWITGIPDVAMVFFVRKRCPEIQYLRTTISEARRKEYEELVETTVGQIEAAHFPSHCGVRFPQNGCVTCRYLGLCLNRQDLVDSMLTRASGGECDWLDQLGY